MERGHRTGRTSLLASCADRGQRRVGQVVDEQDCNPPGAIVDYLLVAQVGKYDLLALK